MGWHFVFRTTNLVTGEFYFGIHKSFDLYFGSPGSYDAHVGTGKRIKESLEKYGRLNFNVKTLYTEMSEQAAKDRLKQLQIPYDHPLCLNRETMNDDVANKISETLTGVAKSSSHADKIRQALLGKKKTTEHKEKLVAAKKKGTWRWINNGTVDKAHDIDVPVPEGWSEGKVFRKRNRKPKELPL